MTAQFNFRVHGPIYKLACAARIMASLLSLCLACALLSSCQCITCPAYSAPTDSGTDCMCQGGMYKSNGQCLACPVFGMSSDGLGGACFCGPGRYSFLGECKLCNHGYYCPDGVTSSLSPPGTFSFDGFSAPRLCPGGTYNAMAGGSACSKVAVDRYSFAGASRESICPTGFSTCNKHGADKCTPVAECVW